MCIVGVNDGKMRIIPSLYYYTFPRNQMDFSDLKRGLQLGSDCIELSEKGGFKKRYVREGIVHGIWDLHLIVEYIYIYIYIYHVYIYIYVSIYIYTYYIV